MSDQPDQMEKLRAIAGQVFSGYRLDSFVNYSRLDAFTNEAGEIDEKEVMGHLTAIHAATQSQPQQSHRNWRQSSGGFGPAKMAGHDARRELKKRRRPGGAAGSPHSLPDPESLFGKRPEYDDDHISYQPEE
jgi:hypothetical protein